MTKVTRNVRHLDLFSGIGGFAYAARTVWRDRYENVGFCEIDPFCQSVLKKNFPDCRIFGDIRAFADTVCAGLERSKRGESAGYNGQRDRERSDKASFGPIDLITGGFPCQPFSVAGRRRGTDDDRYLWPEMYRVIRGFTPAWVIAENVGGLVTWNGGMVLEQVCADLENEGYEVQPFIIPAVAVNAPHRRDRVWIIAHAVNGRPGGEKPDSNGTSDRVSQEHRTQNSSTRQLVGASSDWQSNKPDWNQDWKEVAFATCYDRVDDGLSRRVVYLPNGSTISHARWRKESLKAYGNAIVPQVAIQIMEAIKGI